MTRNMTVYERSMLRSFERGSESANLARLESALYNNPRRLDCNGAWYGDWSSMLKAPCLDAPRTKCLAQLKQDVLLIKELIDDNT